VTGDPVGVGGVGSVSGVGGVGAKTGVAVSENGGPNVLKAGQASGSVAATSSAWSLPEDNNSSVPFGKEFKDSPSSLSSRLGVGVGVGIDGAARGSTAGPSESMFGKLTLSSRSKPLVIVDDSSSGAAGAQTKQS